jgi:hypothetical protein
MLLEGLPALLVLADERCLLDFLYTVYTLAEQFRGMARKV